MLNPDWTKNKISYVSSTIYASEASFWLANYKRYFLLILIFEFVIALILFNVFGGDNFRLYFFPRSFFFLIYFRFFSFCTFKQLFFALARVRSRIYQHKNHCVLCSFILVMSISYYCLFSVIRPTLTA